ncbi:MULTISPECIES: TonB-dependent siderophore receptor [unclassified Janthinobacterium]|uniref:TonB-dependent receptor plug domain-containing protein n=1 Tax=unclassified Janthinobacterium TaxID=2610881 RepID=UPI0016219EB6|nr:MULTISPECIES: TonB-dependent receptor [unclassified Janthinobacterium]MBB5366587.1 outer membrane receptor protein involved in Fe transport [Janthinobacterium sp. K2C7]MBB5380935.1 outer membrane receptor protein involved in Fe transport [Janthinobacterium sp. K2Li3]MBB5384969.1 outer membrane receptor protein involved in Fe transport [Janthinobacterium sp. K2E3]
MILRRPFALRLTVVAAAVLFAWNAQAQQNSASSPADAAATPAQPAKPLKVADAPAIQTVEVKGSGYDPRRDDTASKMIVSSEEILKYGDTNVTDVLKRLPGITVSGAAGRSGGEIRMRGLGSGYTQILLNGERAPAGFSLDTLSPDVIERIEILHAASAEYSTQSIAGTINVVLKKAVKTAQRDVKLGVGGGRDAFSSNGNLQLSDKDGIFSYSLAASFYRYDYHYENPALDLGYLPDGQQNLLRRSNGTGDGRSEGLNLSPRLNWAFPGGDNLTAQFFINGGRNESRSHSRTDTILGLRPDYDTNDGDGGNHYAYGRTDLSWVRKLDGGAKLELGLRAGVGNNSSDNHPLGYIDGVGLALDRNARVEASEKNVSSTGKYSSPLIPGHALSMGWDAGYSKRDEERRQREAALPGGRPPINIDEDFNAYIKRLALYAQDEWDITPRWSMYAGVRWEGIDTRSIGNSYDEVQQRSSVWSPLLQTLWKLPDTKGDQVRLALTRTYKAPATSSLIPRRMLSTNNSQTEPDREGNPNLKPELALGIDASYEHYWAEGALLSARASARRIDGYTRQGLLFIDDRWVSTPVNDGRANTQTLELEAKFPLRAVFSTPVPAIDLRASVSRNWSQVEQVPGPNNRLDQQTPVSGNFGIDYKTPDGVLTTGGSFNFRNGGPVRITERQSAYSSPRRDLDLYALWKFNPKNQLRLSVSNLLAQDFESDTRYTDATGTIQRNSISPSSPQARATMEMKF